MRQRQPYPSLLAFRKQNLLLEFASLRHTDLDGIYVTITPGDPTLWVGVLFVQKGPYAPAVLRFQLAFPPSYPDLPPLVTFSTDIFHPLLTPLTTYTYTTTSAFDAGTADATDEERLPPGGFSLRHGFPSWFARAQRGASGSPSVSRPSDEAPGDATAVPTGEAAVDPASTAGPPKSRRADMPVAEVLRYIRSTFSDEAVLDSVPLEAAANPGAFHAWRTHRQGVASARELETRTKETANSGIRRPGEWNWEGVWEERVRKGIRASLSEPILYGGGVAGDDIIRFLDADPESLERMKQHLDVTLGRIQGGN